MGNEHKIITLKSVFKLLFYTFGLWLIFYIMKDVFESIFWSLIFTSIFLLGLLNDYFLKNYLLKKFKMKFSKPLEIFIFVILIFGVIYAQAYFTTLGSESNSNLLKLEKIVQDYHETHIYSLVDLFVCTDTSIDVWNLVKTEGINAQICAGNIEQNLSSINNTYEELSKLNHAWVLAETDPFEWIALETTGGYLVYGNSTNQTDVQRNALYYYGWCFDNPSEFKKFITLRDDYFKTCDEANRLVDEFNKNYAGKIMTFDTSEFEGRVNAKGEECEAITNQLNGLLI